MSNCNTISRVSATGYPLVPVAGTSTAYPALSPLGGSSSYGPFEGGKGSTRALLTVPANSNSINLFKIRAVAKASASGACNFTLSIYWNKGDNTDLTTFTNDVLIIGSGTQALASASGLVWVEAFLTYDDVAKQLAGGAYTPSGFSNIPTTPAIIQLTSNITATNPVTTSLASTGLQFFAVALMSANVTNTTLVDFSCDAV